jgi:protein-S-isoprenylcysteine O-methyltransferase Ste14
VRAFELKIPPVAVFIVFALIMWAASAILSATSFALTGASAIACLFALVGAGIAVAGVYAFRRHDTTVNPMKPETTAFVVTAGIYRFTRNPMYLGLAFMLFGWAMYLSNLVALLLVPVFAAYTTQFQIKPEERALLEKFGRSFADYMLEVRRWV